MRHRLLLTTIACVFARAAFAQDVLFSDLNLTVTSEVTKVFDGKNREIYKVKITARRTIEELYFQVPKSGNQLIDLMASGASQYVSITTSNIFGVTKPKVRYIKGEKARLLSATGDEIYLIPETAIEEFETTVAPGSKPEVTVAVIITPKTLVQVNFLKSTDAELFYGVTPDRSRFLYLQAIDSLLIKSDQMLSWQAAGDKKISAEFIRGAFLMVGGSARRNDSRTFIGD